ncbi:MAG: hypothetical protein KA206_02215 [Paludibacter sp.]|nr:hypothetical protein [Paludibacter sp.]
MKTLSIIAIACTMGLATFAESKVVYDFDKDVVVTVGSSTPAKDIVISSPNIATAGVVSYTDAANAASNVLRAFSGGQRGGTGVIDLNLFPAKAKNYSVTWKQYSGDITKDYKVGAAATDNEYSFSVGKTQFFRGLAIKNLDFFIDDVTYTELKK